MKTEGVSSQVSLMTINEVAGYLKVSRRTIYDWLKHNKIPAVKLVGRWRFYKERIDAWVNSGQNDEAPGLALQKTATTTLYETRGAHHVF